MEDTLSGDYDAGYHLLFLFSFVFPSYSTPSLRILLYFYLCFPFSPVPLFCFFLLNFLSPPFKAGWRLILCPRGVGGTARWVEILLWANHMEDTANHRRTGACERGERSGGNVFVSGGNGGSFRTRRRAPVSSSFEWASTHEEPTSRRLLGGVDGWVVHMALAFFSFPFSLLPCHVLHFPVLLVSLAGLSLVSLLITGISGPGAT